jgi:membrane protease YdiL (CAAX protease family)
MERTNTSPFTKDVILAIVLFYFLAGTILFVQVGPWEAVRHVIINGMIVAAWLWSAERILGDTPIPEIKPIRFPVLEFTWALGGLIIVVSLAANKFAGWISLPSWISYVVIYGTVLVLFIGLRYPFKDLGIAWPSKSGWWALLVVILINFIAAIFFRVVPQGEAVYNSSGDLANQITGPLSVLLIIVGLLFRAALPEELLLRVTLQPRLARYIPLGWAILVQALLFMAGHLPQQMIKYQRPFILALGYLLTVDNGLIGGYLWYRTRSLPLLVILHLFAYPRFGI